MPRILHISDLHFGPPYVEHVGQALLKIAPELEVDAVVASGDFTQRAKRDEFAQAREFLSRLPDVPTLTVPGNHDVPLYRIKERIRSPHALYREYISQDLDTVIRLPNLVMVGLDSTAPHHAITNGRIRQWQLDFCAEMLQDAPAEAIRIVVAHHHFAPAPDYLRDSSMPKSKRAMEKFLDLGVEAVLGGHLHRAYIGNSLDLYPGRRRDAGLVIVQCGTTTSRRGRGREREKNSFNLIEIDDRTFCITHYLYFHEADGFAPFSRHVFPRRGFQRLPAEEQPSAEVAST